MVEKEIKPIDMMDTVPEEKLPEEIEDIMTYGAVKKRIKVGDEIPVSEIDPTLVRATVGVGWDMKGFESNPLDLDASVFLLNKNEKTRMNEDFVFYNNPQDLIAAVRHAGDSRTGAGDGDDESIQIELTKLSFEIVKIVFTLSIYDDEMRGDDFSKVQNVYIRLVNSDSGHELFRFEMDDELLTNTNAIIVGELERFGPKWVFRARGECTTGGLTQIAVDYGIIVSENVQA